FMPLASSRCFAGGNYGRPGAECATGTRRGRWINRVSAATGRSWTNCQTGPRGRHDPNNLVPSRRIMVRGLLVYQHNESEYKPGQSKYRPFPCKIEHNIPL